MLRPLRISLLATAFSSAATGDVPRIDLLTPSSSFPLYGENLIVADMDRDGDSDLVHLPSGTSGNSEGDPHAYWIENLGNRQFGPVRLAHLSPTGAEEYLSDSKLINLIGDDAPEFFANHLSASPYLSEPLALTPTLRGPAPATGTSLATPSDAPWQAIDLDADNQGELIRIAMTGDETSSLRILDRQHDGSFAESLVMEAGYLGSSPRMEVLDLDADGDLDLGVYNGWWQIFERTGPRAFIAPPPFDDSVYGSLPFVDLNGDNLPDSPSLNGYWQENVGDLVFEDREPSPALAMVESALFRQIVPRAGMSALIQVVLPTASEGYELVVTPFDSTEPISRLAVPAPAGSSPAFLRYADLDGDNHLDLVFSYSTANSASLRNRVLAVAWGSPSGLLEPQPVQAGPADSHKIFTADFNRDKCTDLISGPDALGHYRIRYNQGQAGLADGLLLDGLEIPGTSLTLLAVGRIDKDKFIDLVCSYSRQPAVNAGPETAIVVVRGRKDGSFIKPVLPAGGLQFAPGGITAGELVDWDRDGDLDLVGSGRWRENVRGSFPAGQRFLVDLGITNDFLGNPITIGSTLTGDLDGDRAPDIISLVYGEGDSGGGLGGGMPKKMLVAYNDGRGGIEATIELPVTLAARDFLGNPVMPGAVAITDLNADKLPDLWIREVTGTDFLGNPVTVDRWLRNPGRHSRDLTAWVSQPLANTVIPGLALADFDGDGKTEWIGPNGYLTPTKQGPLFSEPFDFTAGIDLSRQPFIGTVDIDADRDADFIIGGKNTPLVVLYNTGADHSKRKPQKPRPIRWLPSLPPVR